MMKTNSLKKLGILGVSFGLMASPLAFAEMEGGGEEQEPTPQEESTQEGESTFNSYDTEQDKGSDVGTEYEEEEEEFTYEEEEEEQEAPTTEEDEEGDSEW